jgi:hypothetical protein
MTGRSPHQFIRQPISGLPEELAGQPWGSKLLAILNKATATDVESRYQSVSEFWDDFSVLSGMAAAAGVPESDSEATVVRSREGARQASESASIQAGSKPASGQPGQECAGRPEIAQPEFRPHTATVSVGDRARPQKARIVIELPERSERAEPAESTDRASLKVDRPEGAASGVVGAVATDGRSAGVDVQGNSLRGDVAALPGSPMLVRAQATKPMASAPRPGMLDRMRRDTQWLVWARRMFVICLVLALIGLIATTYLHFASPDGNVSLTGLLEGPHRDGSIAGALNVYLRSEPDGDTMTMLPAGTRVRVLEDRNNWARVKILRWEGTPPADAPDTGWVYHRFIKFD